MTRRRGIIAGLGAAALVVAVAAAAATTVHWPAGPTSESTGRSPTPTAAPVTIRWFAGLGPVSPATIAAIGAFVARHSSATDGIDLELEVVAGDQAYDALRTEIKEGNPPDIVGPVGIGDLAGFSWAPLNDEIRTSGLGLDVYPPGLLQILQRPPAGGVGTMPNSQIGLPYTVDPGFLFYNKHLFERANLPPPPTRVGDSYMGRVWDWNELARVAARLTVDRLGRNATQPGFSPNDIVQFGFDFPVSDARVMASTFGAGSFVAWDDKTAQIPQPWVDAWRWYQRAMWTSHIAPTGGQQRSFPLASGHVAVALSFPSQIGTYWQSRSAAFSGWGMAVLPSWNGAATSPAYEETFTIPAGTRHLHQAFELMRHIEADPGILAADGRMPADPSLQRTWVASAQAVQLAVFPANQVDWSVPSTMERFVAVPSPESPLRCQTAVFNDYTNFFSALRTTPNLDLSAALTQLLEYIQDDQSCGGALEL